MTAIVTDVRHRTSLALIRDLVQAGVKVIACEWEDCRDNPAAPPLGFFSRGVARREWLSREHPVDDLYALCEEVYQQEGGRPALLPLGGELLGLLAKETQRFAQVCGLMIPTAGQLAVLQSKEKTAKLAKWVGVPTPRQYARGAGESPEEFVQRLPMPCVIRLPSGQGQSLSSEQRRVTAKTPQQALQAYAAFLDMDCGEPSAEEYLPGPCMGCSVLANQGSICGAICHVQLREYPGGGGADACCKPVYAPKLQECAAHMARETNLTGMASFTFRLDGAGNPVLLRVNPQGWAAFPISRAAHNGLGLLWFVLSYNRGSPDNPRPIPFCPLPENCVVHDAASDLMAVQGYVKQGKWGMVKGVLQDFVRSESRDGLWEWSDLRPAIAYYRSLFRR